MKAALRWIVDGLFAIFNLVLMFYAADQDIVDSGVLAWLLLMVLQFLAIVIHESGHAVAAHCAGARLLTFCVGWFAYDFRKRRWESQRGGNREVGGYVAFAFERHGTDTPARRAWIAAAGPLANVATAAVLLLAMQLPSQPPLATEPVAVVAGQPPAGTAITRLPDADTLEAIYDDYQARRAAEQRAQLAEALARVFSILSLAIAALNLIPFDGSDGQGIWRALRRHPARR
ncbi:MAG: site-2 protease family protein [Erythrobacter sp.]|nr:site-2 protease family protein [Erythrobacter sp.]